EGRDAARRVVRLVHSSARAPTGSIAYALLRAAEQTRARVQSMKLPRLVRRLPSTRWRARAGTCHADCQAIDHHRAADDGVRRNPRAIARSADRAICTWHRGHHVDSGPRTRWAWRFHLRRPRYTADNPYRPG